MPKYYAVKCGREIGIYLTWDECKSQVDGFKGALYKSFTSKQDALNYLDQLNDIELIPDSTPKGIFCDGGCNSLTQMYNNSAFGSIVDYLGRDLILTYIDLFSDMEIILVNLPAGLRSVIVAKFNDCKTQQNNGAELLALIGAYRIAIRNSHQINEIYCDSDLLVKYWSKKIKYNPDMDPRKVAYINELIKLRECAEKLGIRLTKISGDINRADLGFH